MATEPVHGTLVDFDPASGMLTFVPEEDFNGADSLQFRVSYTTDTDATVLSALATVALNVTAVNDTPVEFVQSLVSAKNEPVTLTLGSDDDPEVVQLLSLVVLENPLHGTISGFDSSEGTVIYTPNPDYFGTDHFTFTLTDDASAGSAALTSEPGEVHITVKARPVALPQTLTFVEDAVQAISLSAQRGDTEATLTYRLVKDPVFGEVTAFNEMTGALTYVPAEGFSGSDSLTYEVVETYADGQTHLISTAASVSFTTTAVNDAPVAIEQSVVTAAGFEIPITLSGDDADPDVDQTLTFTLLTQPVHGTIASFDPASGDLVYVPDPGYCGPDSITFAITDDATAGSASATSAATTVSIHVVALPTANAQEVTALEDTIQNVTLTGAAGDISSVSSLRFVITAGPSHGTLEQLDPTSGTVVYMPNPGYSGPDCFSFAVIDELAAHELAVLGASAVVNIQVASANDAPIANNQSIATGEGQATSIWLGDGGDVNTSEQLTLVIANAPGHGTLTGFNATTGQVTYTPAVGYTGVDSFTYQLVDGGSLASTPAAVNITVAGINHAPVAWAHSASTAEDVAVTFALSGSDGDSGATQSLTYQIVTVPGHGEVTGFDPVTGVGTYTPAPGYFGSDSFAFIVVDDDTIDELPAMASSPAIVTVQIIAQNDPPVSESLQLATVENQALSGVLQGCNDETDPSQTLTYVVLTPPQHGSITSFDAATGEFTYTPTANYFGTDSFLYAVQDDGTAGGAALISESATVSITVSASHVDVKAQPKATTTTKNVPVILDLSPMSLLPGSPSVIYAILTGPSHGSLGTLNATTGQVLYSPTSGYTGTDAITFSVTDLRTGSVSQARLLIDVRNTTSLPSANSDAFQARNSDGTTLLDVLANDTYNQVGSLHVISVSAAAGGTASIVAGDPNASGPAARDRVQFVPNAGYTGQQVLSYTVQDSNGHQSVGNLSLTVAVAGANGVDGTPSVGGQGYTADPGATFTRPLGGNAAASKTNTGVLSKTWTDPAGQTYSGTGTQNWTTDLSAFEYSNANWTYVEAVTWSYDVIAGPVHLWGGYTYTLFAGSVAGAEYSFFTMTSHDHYTSSITTSSGDEVGNRATTTAGSGHEYAYLAKWGSQTDLSKVFTGFHSQTSMTSADTDTTYSYVVPGGGVSGTGSGRSSTFDTMSMMVNWMVGINGVWTATGGAVGMGNGAMRSHYQGSGAYLTETATENSEQTVSGLIAENGNDRDSYYYLMTGSLQPDFEWSLNGTGAYSGQGSGNWSQSGSGTYSNWGSGGTQEWSMSGSLSQNSWQQNRSRLSVGLSLESTGWTATNGSNTATGDAGSYSLYSGSGSYTAASTTPDMEWSMDGVKREIGTSRDGSRQTRNGTYNGVAWTYTGSGSGQGESISNESNSGIGTLTQWMRDASGVVSGYVRGPMRESGSTQKSNVYHTSMALDSAGAWLTEGSGSGWSETFTHSSYSAQGQYVYDHIVRNAAQSGVEQTHSALNSEWTKLPTTDWMLTSGSGSGDNSTKTERSYSGQGTYTISGWSAGGMPSAGMLLPGTDPSTGLGMTRWAVTTTTRSDSGGDESHSVKHLTMGVVDGAWKITSGWGSGSGESHASASYTSIGDYGYNTESMLVEGTHNASGGYSTNTDFTTLSSWDPNAAAVNGWLPPGGGWVGSGLSAIGGWVTTGTANGSASDNLHTESSGLGDYSLVRNLVNGESTASGTVTEDASSDEVNSSQWTSVLPAGEDWTLSTGSGSSFGSSTSNFALIGSGEYSILTPTGSGSFSFLSERHFQDEYEEESHVVDGAWRITSGDATGSGSSRDWYASSGSGIFYRPSRWGGDTAYRYFEASSTDDRFSFTKHAAVGADGDWHATGSGTSVSSASNENSKAVNRGKYQRSIDGGTVHGFFDDVETTLSLEDFTSHFDLDANGNWVQMSGSGSSYGGAGGGQVFGGTGNYALSGMNIYSDGASGAWSVQGTIQESGSRNGTEGETWTHAFSSGSWAVVSKSGSGTEGDYSEFWNTASGTYSRGFVTGTFSRSEHDVSNSFRIFSLSGSGNGEPTATGSGNSHMSSFSNWSFAGGGTAEIGGTQGNLSESGAGESGITEDGYYQRNGSSSWIQSTGSVNIFARSRTNMEYEGYAPYEYSGSTGATSWTWQGMSLLSIRESSLTDDISDFTYLHDDMVLTDARFESASSTVVRGSYSASGSYEEPYFGGSISGTMSASGHEETGTSLASKNVYRSGSWHMSGSGTGWGDAAADYMYTGSGTYNYLGILGSVTESGNSRTTSHGDKQYRQVNGVWKVKGTGTTTASGSEQYAFSGAGVYSCAIPGGVLTGTQHESGGEHSSYDYTAGWQLGVEEKWVLVSGSGGGSVNGEYHSAADASGSYSRLFDGDGLLSGSAIHHTQLDYTYSYGGTADVADHAWVTSSSGQMTGTSARLYSYSGSGTRSYSNGDAHTSTQNTSTLAESGASGDSEQFGWEWQDNPDGYTWSSVRAVTNSGSGTYAYSSSEHSQYSYATGNIATGNGTVTSGTTDSDVTQTEQQGWSFTTTYHQSYASGETTEWSETTGSGSGTGHVYTDGVSQWSWQSATSTSTVSKSESRTSNCGTELEDNYEFTANWSHLRGSDGSVSLNGTVDNHVWGSGQVSRSYTDAWSATYQIPAGSGSSSGQTYSTGDSSATISTTPLPGYNLMTHTTGFYSGAYNQGRLIPTWLGGTPVSGSYTYYYPGGGGTGSSGGGGAGGQGGDTDPGPLEGGPWFVAVNLEVGSQFLVGPEGVLTMGEGQQATTDEIAAMKEDIGDGPSPYADFFDEWIGENIVRPMVGDATLAGASDFQLFAGTTIFSSVLVVGAWLAPGKVAGAAISGAIIGAGYNLAHQLDNGDTVDWGQVGNAFAAGGITGAFAGAAMGIGAAAIPGFCTAATVVGAGMGVKSLGNAYHNFNEGQTYTAAMDAALGAFAVYGAVKGAFGCFAGGTVVVCVAGRQPRVAEDKPIEQGASPELAVDSPWWSDVSWWVVVASGAVLAATIVPSRKRRVCRAADNDADSDVDAVFASWEDQSLQDDWPQDDHMAGGHDDDDDDDAEFEFTGPLESDGWASSFADDDATDGSVVTWLAETRPGWRGPAAEGCVAVLEDPCRRAVPHTARRVSSRETMSDALPARRIPKKSLTNRVARGLLALAAMVGLLCGIAGVCERAPDPALAEFRPVAAAQTDPAADAAYVPIEQVQLGQRLVGANPLTEDVELDEPDPALARTVVLEATKPDGQLLHAELIWPVEWVDEVGATVEGQIEVTFGEIETTGTARVVAIGPCPELEPGPGALVIGRYRHELVAAPMVELTLDDDSESVHVTANHPYWSVDRQDFTPAGQLRVGENVDTLSGTAHVAAARSYRYTGTVYNLETTEHVYLVGSGGTLVHNNRNCLLGRNGNRSTGEGRDHVTYQGIKNRKPYSGYASAPSRLKLTPKQIIGRRYGWDFSEFKGGKPPDSVYYGRGSAGKRIARGLEQYLRGGGNKINPVSDRNPNAAAYATSMKRWLGRNPDKLPVPR
ncbi:MAG: tandem-95 repeat protein [Pirellulaceae bacterium]